ncbi:MAG: hypothetical protein ACRDQA_27720 [Nocardioidaceae bacterium]
MAELVRLRRLIAAVETALEERGLTVKDYRAHIRAALDGKTKEE